MPVTYDEVTLSRDGINLLALPGPAVFERTFDLVRIPRIEGSKTITEDTIGLGWVPGLDAGITLFYAAEAALTATIKYDAGAVDIDYVMQVPEIVAPAIHGGTNLPYFLNMPAVWDTSAFQTQDADLTTHAPDLDNTSLSIDFDYVFNAGVAGGFISVLDEFTIRQSDFLPDPLQVPPEYQTGHQNILEVSSDGVFLFGEALTGAPSYTFNQSGIVGFLGLPNPVPDTPGTDPATGHPIGWSPTAESGNAQLPTLSSTGDGANFGNIELHLFDFLASVIPILKPLALLNGRIGTEDNYLDWTVIDLYPHLGIQLSQEIRFVPTGVGVHIVTRIGGNVHQEIWGELGDEFVLDTPVGEGNLEVTPSYTLHGFFENSTGIRINGGVHLTVLQLAYGYDIFFDSGSDSFAFGPDTDIVSFASDPIYFYEPPKLPVTFAETAGEVFYLRYENFPDASNADDQAKLTEAQQDYPIDLAFANYGDDTITGNANDNRINAGFDDDIVLGSDGDDTISGGQGDDFLFGNDDNDEIYGGTGHDLISGGDGDDYLHTGHYDFGSTAPTRAGGRDTVDGGDGSDRIVSQETDEPDVLDGGVDLDGTPDVDVLFLYRTGLTAPMVVDMADVSTFTGVTLPDGTIIRNFERFAFFQGGFGDDVVMGGAYGDQIDGGHGDDVIEGRGGNDAIAGGTGDDGLQGGEGDDYLEGGRGNDLLFGGTGADYVTGDEGNDTVIAVTDGLADTLDGGIGVDRLIYVLASDEAFAINMTMASQTLIDGTELTGFERLQLDTTASSHVSFVIGSGYADRIETGAGDDIVQSGGGGDIVSTNAGKDTVYIAPVVARSGAGTGNVIDGGADTDTLVVDARYVNAPGWTLSFVSGADSQTLPDGTEIGNFERLVYHGRETGSVADRVFGGTLDDSISGGAGNDTLGGGGGADTVEGGGGNDLIVVRAGQGGGEIHGGADSDRIEFDFTGSADSLQITYVDPAYTTYVSDGTTFAGIEFLTARGGSGNDYLVGGHLDVFDTVGRSGRPVKGIADALSGGAGNDTLDGGGGRDVLYGGDGDDTIHLGTGGDGDAGPGVSLGDEIGGGAGTDTLIVDLDLITQPVVLGAPDTVTTLADGTRITGIERIETTGGFLALQGATIGGGSGDESITGSNLGDSLMGAGGNDTLVGRDGYDTLIGGDGFDVVDYSSGLIETFSLDGPGFGGGGGGVLVDLAAGEGEQGDAEGDQYVSVEGVYGTRFGNDTLAGNDADNLLVGFGGIDELIGGDGDDTLEGGADGDELDGGAGSDWASYAGIAGSGGIVVGLGEGAGVTASLANAAINTGDAAFDTYTSIENLRGTDYADVLTGNGGDNVLEGGGGGDGLAGGGGRDTASYANARLGVTASLRSPSANRGEAFGDAYSSIENLLGSANDDALTGNTAANRLDGQAGKDRLTGEAGADTLIGGDGNDQLSGGNDDDMLDAGDGNDRLDGGVGYDTMAGGTGNDTYVLDREGDVVIEVADSGEGRGGIDQVRVGFSYQLGELLENLTLTGTGDFAGEGNDVANVIVGNTGRNALIGADGNDSLDGGANADRMAGGRGNDTYVVDNAGDGVDELDNEGRDSGGIDLVRAGVTFQLSAEIENLTLTGTAAIEGRGNDGANTIVGNIGANVLRGYGGNDKLDGDRGADVMYGGGGSDTYIVESSSDQAIEDNGAGGDSGGIDVVMSSATFTLGSWIEALTLTGSAGIHGIGNSHANKITGNAGANTLSGAAGNDTISGGAGNDRLLGGLDADRLDGGAGFDTMLGGQGNDTYIVDSTLDVVDEGGGVGVDQGGVDLVQSSVSVTLAAFVENLTLTGTARVNGTGNALANTITGNGANNYLQGGGGNDSLAGGAGNDELWGGDGNDTLFGGAGSDTFAFHAFGGMAGIDQVQGFSVANDRIQLDTDAFLALEGVAGGLLLASNYVKGAGATTADHHIVYNSVTGALSYDADGSGAGGTIQFATLATNLNLTASNFILV